MKIGIIGTRGIPNHYGGFEQFADYLSVDLVGKGHQVTVYNSSLHPYKEATYQGVQLVHCKDPEGKLGTAGQFLYDLNCILDARKRGFDIILQLGYTSSSIWHWLMPKSKSVIVTNMDGLEWKRSKYSKKVQKFLKWAEKLGAKNSHVLVADSKGIQEHLKNTYGIDAAYIPYGAEVIDIPKKEGLNEFHVDAGEYFMLVARMEPENNIETILDGYVKSNISKPFLVIGNPENDFGKYLQEKFQDTNKIKWIGPVYDIQKLNALRWYAKAYFHGHSVGGTNPSLLEAMASNAFIIANDNIFNRAILGNDALYFNSDIDIAARLLEADLCNDFARKARANNLEKIAQEYTWDTINTAYEKLFEKSLSAH